MHISSGSLASFAALMMATVPVGAIPVAEPQTVTESTGVSYPNLGVILQTTPGVFEYSANISEAIRGHVEKGIRPAPIASVKHESHLGARASSAHIEYCSDAACSECTTYSGTYGTNFCLSAPSTNCIIVYDFDNAHIHYWNHAGCNGRITGYNNCGPQTTRLSAPGTNSIGIQTGC
ncbi:Uncharacterized protein PECH_008433 [Penicillium ucsense]|uniref:Uncharacterized protein n=1 Tax=Penicillium ucsense TaxID=2839758 RepID=A0A8J8W3H1_9EURO|nr:Uncharacterized protein PECM_008242 [Penicillium ucsense]KAF7734190.1 Uncharacterized protein PECH_008433 [Penicillium ucsense]